MKIHRTKNAARNIVFSGLTKIVNLIVPFIMRSVILHFLGVQYLGLSGLFRSILSILNLAELGVGSAMVFSMYKPIAEDDTDTICALMRLYRSFYRLIGLFIAIVGLALTPFLRTLIKGDLPPDMNLYILYFMNLGNTVLTYWLFAYKNCLLAAHQRGDIGSKISLAVHLVEYVLKIAVLVFLRNYYIYLGIQLATQIAINVLTSLRVDKLYPQYSPRGSLPREQMLDIIRRVRDLFTSKFSNVIFNSADTLVITAFMGLAPLAIFQNYFFVITSLRILIDVIVGACIAGIGNSLVTESEEKNYRDLERYSFLFAILLSVSTPMLLCMYQPFIEIWMGKDYLLSFATVICFTVYYYSMGVNKLINMFKDAAGIWRRDRWRPLVGAFVNLGLNLATVQWLGLYGVVLSSVISIVLVQIPWLFHNLFQEVFPHKYLWRYVKLFSGFVAVTFLCCSSAWLLCSLFQLDPWPTFFVNMLISAAVPSLLFFLIYRNHPLFHASVKLVQRLVFGKR